MNEFRFDLAIDEICEMRCPIFSARFPEDTAHTTSQQMTS